MKWMKYVFETLIVLEIKKIIINNYELRDLKKTNSNWHLFKTLKNGKKLPYIKKSNWQLF